MIPSNYAGEEARTHKYQEHNGLYHMLWSDQDDNPPTIEELSALIFSKLACDCEIYTSISAKEGKQKSRVILPLTQPLAGDDYLLAQECLNDWLVSHKITPDRASERTAQVCYLPNRGEFYANASQRDGIYFDPLSFFEGAIAKKKSAVVLSEHESQQKREQAKQKREQRKVAGFDSAIDEFNSLYQVEEILIKAGYGQKGNNFRHPNSESGSYSASVKDMRVHSLSSSDLLFTNGAGAHTAFSAFKVLFHGDDLSKALKDAGDNWLSINGETWNLVKQRENAQSKEVDTANFNQPYFNLKKFSLNGDSEAMKAQMLTDTYVLGELAILGQLTAFYAKPNSGKTLLTIHLLIEAINKGNIKGDDVFYINADDNFKGLLNKLQLAEKYKFHMIAPGFKDFNTIHFGNYLTQLMEANESRGKVIILDTLKKFTNIMDKNISSGFARQMRMFVTKGGTIIMLAHTNKNRDNDGKVVFSGTSDIVDDVDCAYTLDVNDNNSGLTEKAVIFENIKSRGDVAKQAAYKYLVKASDYEELLDSVCEISEGDAKIARAQIIMDELLSKNEDIIEAITDVINSGVTLKTELIRITKEQCGSSANKVSAALKAHTGKRYIDGHRWSEYKGEKHAKLYRLISINGASETAIRSYQQAKDGEF
jgi:hypothetical protein